MIKDACIRLQNVKLITNLNFEKTCKSSVFKDFKRKCFSSCKPKIKTYFNEINYKAMRSSLNAVCPLFDVVVAGKLVFEN